MDKEYKKMIDQIRSENGELIASMPHDAETPEQDLMKEKYGSPRAFAQRMVNSIGEISCLQAHSSIFAYKKQWDKAS